MKRILTLMVIGVLCLATLWMLIPHARSTGSTSAYLTNFIQLTTNPYDDRGAGWSPDSSKIAYSAFADSWYRNIWVMNSDGSNKKQLTFGNVVDDSPSYSPDGTKIVFMRYGLRGIDGSDLMIMNANGTNIQQLTSTGLHRGQPRWFHDGQRLAFYYGGAGTTTNEIHIMNTDGTNEVTVVSGNYTVMNPYWSPDDTKLVYTMDDGIWTVNTSPPYQKTRVFQTSLPTMYAVFSPDGEYIMYASGVYGAGQHQDLYLIDIYGNFIAQLTHDTKFGYQFDWSPDGQYIAYDSTSSGNYDVWRATIVGVPRLSLTPAAGFASTTIVGSGFSNDSKIIIAWDGTTIPSIPSPVTTDANGNFTALISVPTQTSPGAHTVNATDKSGNWATATFTVVNMTGPQGPAGLQGQQGPKGDTGDTGPPGPAGLSGDTQLALIAFPTAASIVALCIAVVALLRKKT